MSGHGLSAFIFSGTRSTPAPCTPTETSAPGAWRGATSLPTAEMDVDWTALGLTRMSRPRCGMGTRQRCSESWSVTTRRGSDLRADFDIVVTAEGHEAASHVFETRGGIDWAKRNMRRVTILHPDGTTRTYDLSQGTDPVFELAMSQHLAELRTLATRGGDYNRLFDANGNLLPQDRDSPRAVGPLHQTAQRRRLLYQQARDSHRRLPGHGKTPERGGGRKNHAEATRPRRRWSNMFTALTTSRAAQRSRRSSIAYQPHPRGCGKY